MIPNFLVHESITSKCPNLRFGIISCQIQVEARSEALNQAIEETLQKASSRVADTASIRELPVVSATRSAYKALGKDPSRYRPSAESLLRRTVQGKGLYQVSNAVDALNLISVDTGFSIGGYDQDKIEGAVSCMAAPADTDYEGIGRGALNIENLPTLFDQKGAFGTPTSDSVRTSVTGQTSRMLLVFYDFSGDAPISAVLEQTQMIFEAYVYGKDFELLTK